MSKRSPGPALLRACMASLKLTQSEVAARLEVPQATVSRWLSGERSPNLEMAVRLRREMQIPVEAWLLEDAGTGTDG